MPTMLETQVDTPISISDEEARRFARNAIVVEKNVIMNEDCRKTRAELESHGFSVYELSLTEFTKAGGVQSASCSQLKDRPDAPQVGRVESAE